MKALGISFGRPMQNSEVMLKQALKQLKARGFEVEMVRFGDLNIKECTGCCACVGNLMGGGKGACVIKDDMSMLDEKMMDADAIIYAAPIYALAPRSTVKKLVDRMSVSHDFAFRYNARKQGEAMGLPEEKLADKRFFKDKAVAFITAGGARTKNWTSLGLTNMNLLAMSSGHHVVDAYNGYAMMSKPHVVCRPEVLERMTALGDHVADAVENKTFDKWYGDEPGTCPVCHDDLISISHKGTEVECPLCGIIGNLSIVDGEIKVEFSEAQKKRSRMYYDGKLEHYLEIRDGAMSMAAMAKEYNLPEMLAPYKEI